MAKNINTWEFNDTTITQEKPKFNLNPSFGGSKKVKLKDVAWALDKLATILNAGIPIFRAVGMIGNMRKKYAIGEVLLDIQEKLADGMSFAKAVRAHEDSFGSLICALIESGENAGKLQTSLEKAAAITESKVKLRKQTRKGLIYPVAVITITTVIITALLIFVVPRFSDIYASLGSELPWLTQLLVTASEKAPFFALILAAIVLALYLVHKRSKKDINLRRKIDALKFKMPVFGALTRKSINARIASTLASLLSAGVPLLKTLDYASKVANNVIYAEALDQVKQKVTDGSSFSNALSEAPKDIFPELLIQLAEIGENSGELNKLMEKYAIDAENEVSDAYEAMTSLIEPAMLVFIGAIVGVAVVALYMPIIDIGNQIK